MNKQELEQYKAYLEMKAESAERAARTFDSTFDTAISISKANGLREALSTLESGSYKWYKRPPNKALHWKTKARLFLKRLSGL